jgi:hypothetical protein
VPSPFVAEPGRSCHAFRAGTALAVRPSVAAMTSLSFAEQLTTDLAHQRMLHWLDATVPAV